MRKLVFCSTGSNSNNSLKNKRTKVILVSQCICQRLASAVETQFCENG